MVLKKIGIIGVIFFMTLLAGAACSKKEPLSDLSEGQDGKILFNSTDPSFKDLLSEKSSSDPVTIVGTLSMPGNPGGKVPAAIILHTATGIQGPGAEHYSEIARSLNSIGVAAFVVDSHKTRKIKTLLDGLTKITFGQRVADAYAALKLLSTHPGIDKNRIAVIGLAGGGSAAIFAASKKVRHSLTNDDLKFAAHISYYPVCLYQFRNIDFTGAPILMLLAEKDNLAPPQLAMDYAERIRSSGVDIQVMVYEGAYHAFDFSILAGNEFPFFYDFSGCQERYCLLNDDGSWFSPYLNKTVDALADFGDFTEDCRPEGKKGTLGGPGQARTKSIEDYQAFLRQAFKIS